jgi:hypothetical protein
MRNLFFVSLFSIALLSGQALACEAVTVSANCAPVQPWTVKSNQPFNDCPPYSVSGGGHGFPYVIPSGKFLGITDIMFASKNITYAPKSYKPQPSTIYRNSYAMLWSVLTTTEHDPSHHFARPYELPSGFVLDGAFSNSSLEPQNMHVIVLGWLSDDPLFRDCR